MGDIYQNVTTGGDSDSDFTSEEENEIDGSDSQSEFSPTSSGNQGFKYAQSGLQNHSFNHEQNTTFNAPEPEDYEQPEFENTSSGNQGFKNAQSGLSNHPFNNEPNTTLNAPEPEDYEQPEFDNNGSDGVPGTLTATNLVGGPFRPRGPSILPRPLFGQNSPFRSPSYPRPSILNTSQRFLRARQTGPSSVGLPPGKITPPPIQFPPRFGNHRPTPPSFRSQGPFVQSLNARLSGCSRLPPEIKPGFSSLNVKYNILPHLPHPKLSVNDSKAQLSSKINFSQNSTSPNLKKPNSKASSLLPATKPKLLPNTHLLQNSNQSTNIRQAKSLNVLKKTPPLVKEIVDLPERPTWIDKHSGSHKLNRIPPPPTLPKPLNNKNFIPMSSVQHNSDRDNPSDENLVSSMETLKLDSGEKIPMTELYKALLNEKYFHAISKGSTQKYLTEGTFLLRPSRSHTDEKPLTLVLKYNGKAYNFSIEKRKSGLYSVGSEKQGELTFATVQELISYYHDNAFHFEGLKTYFLHPAMKPFG